MSHIIQDLRYAMRMLAKNPLFTAAAVLTLALGIGLNSATFSAVRGILLKPLGGTENPKELVQLYRQWAGMDYGSNSIPHYQDLRDRTEDIFEDVGAYNWAEVSLAADGRSERLMGMTVSANFFRTYGAEPLMGRVFVPGVEDRGPGAHPVVILGNDFWQSRFGEDPDIIGRTLTINGRPFEVVGVMRPEFKGPVTFASIPLYVPFMMDREISPGSQLLVSRGNNSSAVVGRMRPDVTVDRVRERLAGLLIELREQYPDDYQRQLGTTVILQSEAGIHPTFKSAQVGLSTVIMVVVALLLLIACVNVANLFLARAQDRRREMGIRLSVGASRGRVIQQLMTESIVFSLLAGLAGVGLSLVALRFLSNVKPPMDGPWDFAIEMDRSILLFTLGVSLLAGLLFGLAPALQAANPDTVSALKGETDGKGKGSRLSRGLVVVQMALSLILLISSGLFLRSLQGATQIDPGFEDPGSLVMATMDPGLQGYDETRTRAFYDRLREELLAMPDVRAVGFIDQPPLGLGGSDRGVDIPGYEFAEGELRSLMYARVTDGYLEAAGVRLVEGRTFTEQDDDAGPPVIIVNERFRDRFWPGESGIGRSVSTAGQERQVVGVVETGKYRSLGEDPTEFMYFPQRELYTSHMAVLARTAGDPQAVLGRIQQTVRQMDPDLPVYDVRTMEDHMGLALLPARLGGSALGLFGLLGLILAAVGIYGVMAYSVSQRTREIGIRVALGAGAPRVLRLVLGEGMRLALIGTAIGLVGAAGTARLVAGLLYNVRPLDPVAFLGVPAVLMAVAFLAVYVPARRAASVEPMRALKGD